MVAPAGVPDQDSGCRLPLVETPASPHRIPAAAEASQPCRYMPFAPEWCLRRGVAHLPVGERSGPPDTVMFKLLPPPHVSAEVSHRARGGRHGGKRQADQLLERGCDRLFPFMFRDLTSHEQREAAVRRLLAARKVRATSADQALAGTAPSPAPAQDSPAGGGVGGGRHGGTTVKRGPTWADETHAETPCQSGDTQSSGHGHPTSAPASAAPTAPLQGPAEDTADSEIRAGEGQCSAADGEGDGESATGKEDDTSPEDSGKCSDAGSTKSSLQARGCERERGSLSSVGPGIGAGLLGAGGSPTCSSLFSFGFQCFAVNTAGDTLAAACADTIHLYCMATKTLHVSVRLPHPPSPTCACASPSAPGLERGSSSPWASSDRPARSCAAERCCVRDNAGRGAAPRALLPVQRLQFADEDRLLLAATACGHLYVYFLSHQPGPALLAYINLREAYVQALGRLRFLSGASPSDAEAPAGEPRPDWRRAGPGARDPVARLSGERPEGAEPDVAASTFERLETLGDGEGVADCDSASPSNSDDAASSGHGARGNIVLAAVELLEIRYPPAILTGAHRSTDTWRLAAAAAAAAADQGLSSHASGSEADSGLGEEAASPKGARASAPADFAERAALSPSGCLVLLVSYAPDSTAGSWDASSDTHGARRRARLRRRYSAPLALHVELRPTLLLLRHLELQRCGRAALLSPAAARCDELSSSSRAETSVVPRLPAASAAPSRGTGDVVRSLLAGFPLRLLPHPFPCCRAVVVWSSSFTLLDDSRIGRFSLNAKGGGADAAAPPASAVSSRAECRFPFAVFRVRVPAEPTGVPPPARSAPAPAPAAETGSGEAGSAQELASTGAGGTDPAVTSPGVYSTRSETATLLTGGQESKSPPLCAELTRLGTKTLEDTDSSASAHAGLGAAAKTDLCSTVAEAGGELRSGGISRRASGGDDRQTVRALDSLTPQQPRERLVALVAVSCPDGYLVLVDWRQRRRQVISVRSGVSGGLAPRARAEARVLWGATMIGASAASAREVSVRDDGEVLLLRCADRVVVTRLVYPWTCPPVERKTLLQIHRDQQREQRQQFALQMQKQQLLIHQRGESRGGCGARGRGRGRGRGFFGWCRNRKRARRGEDEEEDEEASGGSESGGDEDTEAPDDKKKETGGRKEEDMGEGSEAAAAAREETSVAEKGRRPAQERDASCKSDASGAAGAERQPQSQDARSSGPRDAEDAAAGWNGAGEGEPTRGENRVVRHSDSREACSDRHPDGADATSLAPGRVPGNPAAESHRASSDAALAHATEARKANDRHSIASDESDGEAGLKEYCVDDGGALIITQFIHMDCVQRESYTALSIASSATAHKGLAAAAVDRNGLAALYFLDLSAVVAVEAKVLVLEASKLSPFKQIHWVPDVHCTQLSGLSAAEAQSNELANPKPRSFAPALSRRADAAVPAAVQTQPPRSPLEDDAARRESEPRVGVTPQPRARGARGESATRWWSDGQRAVRGGESAGAGPSGSGNFSCLVALEKKWGTLLFFYPKRTKVWWLLLPDFERLDRNREEIEAADEFDRDSSKLPPWLRATAQPPAHAPEDTARSPAGGTASKKGKTRTRAPFSARDIAGSQTATGEVAAISLSPPQASSSFLPLRAACDPTLLLPSPSYPFYAPPAGAHGEGLAASYAAYASEKPTSSGRAIAEAEDAEAAAHAAISRACRHLCLGEDASPPRGEKRLREEDAELVARRRRGRGSDSFPLSEGNEATLVAYDGCIPVNFHAKDAADLRKCRDDEGEPHFSEGCLKKDLEARAEPQAAETSAASSPASSREQQDLAEAALTLAASAEEAADKVLISLLESSSLAGQGRGVFGVFFGEHPLASELLARVRGSGRASSPPIRECGDSAVEGNSPQSRDGHAGAKGKSQVLHGLAEDTTKKETVDSWGVRREWLTDYASRFPAKKRSVVLAREMNGSFAPAAATENSNGAGDSAGSPVRDLPSVYREAMRRSREAFSAMAAARDSYWKMYAAASLNKG